MLRLMLNLRKNKLIIYTVFFININFLLAQDELLSILNEGNDKVYTIATFKATKVINGQSTEITGKKNLNFIIEHRFGTINSGAYELWGLDQALMRMSLDYGLTNFSSLGLARNTHQKTYEFFSKNKIFRQSNFFPFNICMYNSLFINTIRYPLIKNYPFKSRISYLYQILISRKINEFFSFQISPTLIHSNLVSNNLIPNDQFSVGFGQRIKLSKRVTLNSEYFYRFKNFIDNYKNSLSIGFDIETGGHVFQLHLTNSQGMFEKSFINETTGRWLDGDIYFGFNISRIFSL